MYPHAELKRLAAHKVGLQRDIAAHRAQFVTAATRLAQPLDWIDRMVASWRQLAPLAKMAAVPLAFLATRAVFPRLKFLRPLVRWGPLVFSAVRGLGSALKTRDRSAPH